jgi:hypothetical protein
MKTEEDEAFEELERRLIKPPSTKRPVCVKLVPTGEFHDGIEVVKAVPLEHYPITDWEISVARSNSENDIQFARRIESMVLEKVYV